MSDLDRTVARMNIDRYQLLLARETDGGRRKLLVALLADEEAKLAALIKAQPRKGRP